MGGDPQGPSSPTPALYRSQNPPQKSLLVLFKCSWTGNFWEPKKPSGLEVRSEWDNLVLGPPSISPALRNEGGCRKCRATTRNFHEAPISSLCQQNSVVGPHFHIVWMWRETGIVLPQDTEVLPPAQAWM